jgi:ABC-type lipoprotein export system ATPase subunit
MSNASAGGVLIRGESLAKTYRLQRKEIPVLRDASLAVREGEAVAIVGASGAGKSTLLHLLGGLARPDAGRVRVSGRDLYALSERERATIRAAEIGFVFQSFHLMTEMDVLENVMLPALALARGRRRQGISPRERARELLAEVGLADRAAHTPLELSGGEQQRAAIARALINSPAVVLADEPTGNLDEGTGGQVLEALFRLCRGRGHALLVVTHNERIAAACDRILRLADGAILGGK